MNKWPATQQFSIKEFNSLCLNCPPIYKTLTLTFPLVIDFGEIIVTKDEKIVWTGNDEHVWLRRFERKALKDPNHDWRVSIIGPMYGCVYQRCGNGKWVFIEREDGVLREY